jgi:hypothetical protein
LLRRSDASDDLLGIVVVGVVGVVWLDRPRIGVCLAGFFRPVGSTGSSNGLLRLLPPLLGVGLVLELDDGDELAEVGSKSGVGRGAAAFFASVSLLLLRARPKSGRWSGAVLLGEFVGEEMGEPRGDSSGDRSAAPRKLAR